MVVAKDHDLLYTRITIVMKKNTSVRGLILISLMSLVPLVALAAGAPEVSKGIETFGGLIGTITQSIVRSLATLFATAAMAAFFYGIVQYIWGVRDGKPDKVTAGNKFMVSGLIALFVMFSVWGIIIYTQKIFGIQGQSTILIPDVRIQGGGGTGSPTTPGLPGSPNTGAGSLDGCTRAGAACTVNSAAGTCTNGPASRGYVLYCSPNSVSGGAVDPGTNGGGVACGNINDAETCNSMGCSWDNGERTCSR